MYTINWIEVKTSKAGQDYAKVSLEGQNGDFLMFSKDWPNLRQITPGSEIDGILGQTRDGTPVLQKGNLAKHGPKPKELQISKAMDRKEASINDFQEKKEEAMKLAAAQRDAVLIVTTFYKDLTESEIKSKIDEWRSWFYRADKPLPF